MKLPWRKNGDDLAAQEMQGPTRPLKPRPWLLHFRSAKWFIVLTVCVAVFTVRRLVQQAFVDRVPPLARPIWISSLLTCMLEKDLFLYDVVYTPPAPASLRLGLHPMKAQVLMHVTQRLCPSCLSPSRNGLECDPIKVGRASNDKPPFFGRLISLQCSNGSPFCWRSTALACSSDPVRSLHVGRPMRKY